MVSGRPGGDQGRSSNLDSVSCLSQPPGGVPGTQPLLPNSMDPTRQQGRVGGLGHWEGSSLLYSQQPMAHPFSYTGHPNMGGSMQRMNPPRGMGPMGPGPQVTSCLFICPSVSPAICVQPPSFLSPQSVSPPHFWLSHEKKGTLMSPAPLPACGVLGGNCLWADSGQT